MKKKHTRRLPRTVSETRGIGLVINGLRAAASCCGGQRRLSSLLGISQTQISMVINGKREPCDTILSYLRLRKIVTYSRYAV